jgi:uncharacterized membrane protein YphA (DoxX/SURF4 family)
MATLYFAARLVSAAAFLFYGAMCLVSPAMSVEFERYRMPQMRVLTAVLEMVGALGLLVGPTPRWIGSAAAGLSGLMLAALLVRLRIKDPWYSMLPALLLLLLNLWIARSAWRQDPA